MAFLVLMVFLKKAINDGQKRLDSGYQKYYKSNNFITRIFYSDELRDGRSKLEAGELHIYRARVFLVFSGFLFFCFFILFLYKLFS